MQGIVSTFWRACCGCECTFVPNFGIKKDVTRYLWYYLPLPCLNIDEQNLVDCANNTASVTSGINGYYIR